MQQATDFALAWQTPLPRRIIPSLGKDKLRRQAHSPTVRILICGSKNDHTVRYALGPPRRWPLPHIPTTNSPAPTVRWCPPRTNWQRPSMRSRTTPNDLQQLSVGALTTSLRPSCLRRIGEICDKDEHPNRAKSPATPDPLIKGSVDEIRHSCRSSHLTAHPSETTRIFRYGRARRNPSRRVTVV